MNYEQYYQKGGTYVIPTEVFNELIEENKDKLYQIIYAGLQFDVNKGVYDAFNNLIEENEKLAELLDKWDIKYNEAYNENLKLNHYKLLYQKVKERNEKAIEYIEDRYDYEQKTITHTFDKSNVWELLDILEGNNEIQ